MLRVIQQASAPIQPPLPGGERSSAARVRGYRSIRRGCNPSPAPPARPLPQGEVGCARLVQLSQAPPRPGDPRLDSAEGRKTWVAGSSPAMTARGVAIFDVKERCQPASTCGPGAFGLRAVVRSRVARRAARLDDAWVMMEEPGGRFAHGFFRRTGGAGSATAPGGNRNVSGGLGPIPIQQHAAWASRHTHLRTAHARDRACSHTATPRERAPRQEQILRKCIAQVGTIVKNKVRT